MHCELYIEIQRLKAEDKSVDYHALKIKVVIGRLLSRGIVNWLPTSSILISFDLYVVQKKSADFNCFKNQNQLRFVLFITF